ADTGHDHEVKVCALTLRIIFLDLAVEPGDEGIGVEGFAQGDVISGVGALGDGFARVVLGNVVLLHYLFVGCEAGFDLGPGNGLAAAMGSYGGGSGGLVVVVVAPGEIKDSDNGEGAEQHGSFHWRM